MRKLLQRWFKQPVIRLANRFSSRPDKTRVFDSLSQLHTDIISGKEDKGIIIPFNAEADKFIILSDQHKGARDHQDDFATNEKNYLAALDYYYANSYYYIALGDCEELWKNTLATVKKNNTATFEKEKAFLLRKQFMKVFGNHDLYWDNDPLAAMELKSIYGESVAIYEGIILQAVVAGKPFQVYLTHGHQGDLQSDGNWFSKWFVAQVWGRIQAYLEINPNTPAYDSELKSEHNKLMYEWSSTNRMALVTGHTHQPVFESLTLLERLYDRLAEARAANNENEIRRLEGLIHHRFAKGETRPDFSGIKPTYFNSGCCCYNDGDITGIEIESGCIRLIKWEYDSAGNPQRFVLEEAKVAVLAAEIAAG